jgi:hypothetical protein
MLKVAIGFIQNQKLSKQRGNKTIGNVFEDIELDYISTVRKFRTVQIEGKREVARVRTRDKKAERLLVLI